MLPELSAKLSLDGSGFTRTINKATNQVEGLGKALQHGLTDHIGGLFTGAAIGLLFEKAAERAKEVAHGAEQMGLSTDKFQEVDQAARHAGLGMDDLRASLIKFGAARQGAVDENKALIASFASFGITMEDLTSSTSDLDLIGKMFGGKNLTPEQRDMMREFFGRSGPRFAGLFKELNQGGGNKPAGFMSHEQIEQLAEVKKLQGDIAASAIGGAGRASGGFLFKLSQFGKTFLPGGGLFGRAQEEAAAPGEPEPEQRRGHSAAFDAAQRVKADEAKLKLAEALEKLDMGRLTRAAKELEMEKEIASVKGIVLAQSLPGMPASASTAARTILAQKELELFNVQKHLMPSALQLGSNARIGGFTQNAGAAERTWQQEMLLTNKTIAKNTDPNSE